MPETAAGDGLFLYIQATRFRCTIVSAGMERGRRDICEPKKRRWSKEGQACGKSVHVRISPPNMNQTVFLSRHCYHPTKRKVQIFYLRF
jgi:hypothetical protein